jgi:hypothetical protein
MMETSSSDSPLPTPISLPYWLKGEDSQNFGDFLTEYFLQHVFLTPSVVAAGYRLVGSTIADHMIAQDIEKIANWGNGKMAYWCCGMREDKPLDPPLRARCQFHGIRGPLSRKHLGLPEDTVLGDPGFLMPILFQPSRKADTSGKNICVPHYCDSKSHDELLRLSGAEAVVKPEIRNSLAALEYIIDQIASAKFVLTGSLHAAIVAAAYNVPFAFWDNGHVDIPFKWRDTAALLDIGTSFAPNLKEGEQIYASEIKPRLKKPPLLPMLTVAPFVVRPAILLRAAVADGLIEKSAAQPAELLLQKLFPETQIIQQETRDFLFAQARIQAMAWILEHKAAAAGQLPRVLKVMEEAGHVEMKRLQQSL